MRNLSALALTKITNQYGNEPVVILDIAWTDNITKQYADRTVNNIPGRILEVSDLDNIINVTESADSQEISIILDDTDGTIKTIMDTYDIHKRDVWVYQWFDGLNINDRFLLFRGKISSPVEWNEGERTVSFTVISQLEDKEVGFSPEEGQFPHIPKDLIGQTWPSIFGTPFDVPAVQINKAITGTTLCGVGIISGQQHHIGIGLGGSPPDTRMAEVQKKHVTYVASAWCTHDSDLYRKYNTQRNELQKQISDAWNNYARQQGCTAAQRNRTLENAQSKGNGCNPVRIFGGEDFPRGTIILNINGGLFTGYFEDDWFYISDRQHPENENKAKEQARGTSGGCGDDPGANYQPYFFEDPVPGGVYTTEGYLYDKYSGGMGFAGTHGIGRPAEVLQQFWADAGTEVTLHGNEPITYIVSIVPGIILQVKAYKDFHGEKILVNVPNNLYYVKNVTYGTISTVQIVMYKALSTIEDQDWAGDNIYVTFQSSIGPNIVDILEYLIDRYSDLAINAVSFAAVKTKLAKFPANFALLERKNIVETLQEIAFQARCSLRISNGIFYLSYLPEEPTAVDTLTENDIENQSIIVALTSTEDLVTKFVARWRLSYAQEELDKIILRHNVNKYGIQEEEYEFYIYNQPDIIFKIATFWLIRKANSWKKLKCNVFLNKLNLETFDAVTLDFNTGYVSNSDVKAVIEQAIFDSENQTINLECWLPIKAGSMDEYPFAWPADEEADTLFPTQEDYDAGNAGGDGIGADAVGNLPIGQVPVGDTVIYVGGPNIIFGPQTDHGDPHPSDTGFSAQDLGVDATLAEIDTTSKPALALGMNYALDAGPLELPDRPRPISLILEKTKIFTVYDEDKVGHLSDLLRFDGEEGNNSRLGLRIASRIIDTDDPEKYGRLSQAFILAKEEDSDDHVLAIKTDVKVYDGENLGEFDFMFDTEGEKWGAGTAFLQDAS